MEQACAFFRSMQPSTANKTNISGKFRKKDKKNPFFYKKSLNFFSKNKKCVYNLFVNRINQ